MSGILPALTLLVLVALCLLAFFPVLDVFFGRRVERTRRMIETAPGRSFLVGLANFVFVVILVMILFGGGRAIGGMVERLLGLLALILLIPLVIGAAFGLAGAVKVTGARLLPGAGGLKQTLWGTLALGGACALPFVGWFGMLPYVGLTGLGAVVLSLFSRAEPAEMPIASPQEAADILKAG